MNGSRRVRLWLELEIGLEWVRDRVSSRHTASKKRLVAIAVYHR